MSIRKNAPALIFYGLFCLLLLLISTKTYSLPSFARQTGHACSTCHVQSFGPGLTPTGRNFKLNGYTQVGQGRENMIR